jgi:6-phosphogluconolactonase (cycloisomerase 2 family)
VAVAIDPTGAYAYVADAGGLANTGDISQYSINSTTGALTALQEPTLTISGNPHWLTIDNTTKTLYVPNSAANSVQVLSIGSNGTLSFTASQALAAGSNPNFVALGPDEHPAVRHGARWHLYGTNRALQQHRGPVQRVGYRCTGALGHSNDHFRQHCPERAHPDRFLSRLLKS